MGGKSQPDFGQIAASEADDNRQSVRDQLFANRPDQYTPWGSTTWSQNPYTDPTTGEETMQWRQETSLNPGLQDIFNKQQAIQGGKTDLAGMLTGRMGAEFGQGMDWRGLAPMGQVMTAQYTLPENDIGNPNDIRGHAENAMYNKAQSRLAPAQAGEKAALETKMRAQGLRPGDQAWQSQVQGLGQKHTDAQNQATWGSVDAGRQEAQQMYGQMMGQQQNRFNQALSANQQNFGQGMQQSQYANQIRQMQMAEAMQKRGWSLNEMNALLSGGQVGMPSMPSFNQGGMVQGPDRMGAAAQQASMENASSPWGALAGIAGQGLGAYFSDRRLKTNIKRIGTVKGHPWYSYDYIWGQSSQGVMADEVPAEHVTEIGGFKAVNYGTLLGE